MLQVMKGIMIGDKAPDLDSFSIAFFLALWEAIKEDIMGCSMIFSLEV